MKAREIGFAAALLAACVEPEPGAVVELGAGPPEAVAEQVIDAGAELELAAGAGVGVAVAYLGEGAWQLTTSCDTAVSDAACRFDLVVSVRRGDGALSALEGLELETEDSLQTLDPFALQLLFVTEGDLDGATFSATAGSTVRVSALLYDPVEGSSYDWTDDPRMLSWVGHGAVNWGAPSNPIDLRPGQP